VIGSSRPHPRPHRRDPVVAVGVLLVLTLVVLLPLALALLPADGGSDDAGIGSGAGELSAAALSALHRDLNARRSGGEDLPTRQANPVPPLLAVCPFLHGGVGTQTFSDLDPSSRFPGSLPSPVPAPVGPGPDGVPLLL
jgi:hypothetical protein